MASPDDRGECSPPGTMPLIAALLLAEFGSGTPIAIYIAALCLITTIGVWFAAETRTVSLTAVQPEEKRLLDDERGTATA